MRSVIIFASGPSLLKADCRKAAQSGMPVIAVNSTWKAIPDCDFIYAADSAWWDYNFTTLPALPEKWTCDKRAYSKYKINYHHPQYEGAYNSGQRAVMFAVSLGVKNILLSGFDCSVNSGVHWHEDHLFTGNPTAVLTLLWQRQFCTLSDYFCNNVNIINCSRETSLTCFPLASLEESLEKYKN
jgi:hypothetical protein